MADVTQLVVEGLPSMRDLALDPQHCMVMTAYFYTDCDPSIREVEAGELEVQGSPLVTYGV